MPLTRAVGLDTMTRMRRCWTASAAMLLAACSASHAVPDPGPDVGERDSGALVDADRRDAHAALLDATLRRFDAVSEDAREVPNDAGSDVAAETIDASATTPACTEGGLGFEITGDGSDWVTGGVRYSGATSAAWNPYGSMIDISGRADDGSHWLFQFRGPTDSADLTVGEYVDVERAAFRTLGTPGLDVGGDGRACNRVGGRFVIHAIELVDDEVRRFHATFEQHCERGLSHSMGCVSFTVP